MSANHLIKKFIGAVVNGCYESFRLMLGPDTVCLYPISCRWYALHHLKNSPIYISIPLIILRLLSCNPITGIIRKIMYRK